MKNAFKRNLLIVVVTIIAITIVSFVYYSDKPMIEENSNARVTLISVDYKDDQENAERKKLDLSSEEISDELNDELISVFKNTRIRNRILPHSKIHIIEDGDTHITVKLSLGNNKTAFIYVCNKQECTSAQIGDKDYYIINSNDLFEEISRLIFTEFPRH